MYWEAEDSSARRATANQFSAFQSEIYDFSAGGSMAITESDTDAIVKLLSPERLSALCRLTSSTAAAIELHQETLRLGAALMNVIAVIEIGLRNAICENLSAHFDVADWLINPPASFQWREIERIKIQSALDSARRSEYAKLSPRDKHALDSLAFPNGRPSHLAHLKRAKARRAKIVVSNGKVIAELTLYVWKRLCGPDYEHTLWKPTLKRVFPFKKVKRSEIADQLEVLYQARNRLAHHEPVLHRRFDDTVRAIKFIAQHLGASIPNQQTPLAKLIAEDLAAVERQAAALHARLDFYRT